MTDYGPWSVCVELSCAEAVRASELLGARLRVARAGRFGRDETVMVVGEKVPLHRCDAVREVTELCESRRNGGHRGGFPLGELSGCLFVCEPHYAV